MTRSPTITVLVTCYKEGLLLQRALDSVFSQTDREFELVVVNDASPCEITNRICRETAKIPGIKVIMRNRNGRQSVARNTGVQAARGEVIVPLDGDDVLPHDCIEVVRKAFIANPGADYVFGNYLRKNVDTGEERMVDCSPLADESGWLDARRYAKNYILYGGSPYKRSLWVCIGGYRPALDGWEDVDLWMRAMTAGCKGVYLPHVIYEWHQRGEGVNATTPLSRVWETHLKNKRFHRRFGHWAEVVEGFIDYVVDGYDNPDIRKVARHCLWRVFPPPQGCERRFLRAVLKCVIPVVVIKEVVRLKRPKVS